MVGALIGVNVGSQPVLGSTGPGSIIGVNVLPSEAPATGSLATVGVLTGDGTVAQVTLPTTTEAVQQGLAPVGSLAGALLGEQVGGAVTQLTDGLAPVVSTVTSTANQAAGPLLDTVNGALSPLIDPLTGANGALAPVTGLVETVAGGLTGVLGGVGGDPASLGGSLVDANVGGNAVAGPGTSDTLVGINVLPSGAGAAPAQGQLVTVDVLTQGSIADVALPTTTAGVEAGLQPVGNLAGTLLGPQAGAVVDQVTTSVAPVVAGVTSTVQGVASPLLDTVNGLAPALPSGSGGGEGSNPLAPVTGLLNGVLSPATGGSGATAPVTGLLGGLLSQGN